MTAPVLRVTPGLPASDALALMRDEGVRHAVVFLGSRIVGVLSERDLGGPHGALARRHHSVGELMHEDPILAPPTMPVEQAVHLVRERHIGCLPIVDAGRLVGIVTRSDLLRAVDPQAHVETTRVRPPSIEDDEVRRGPQLASPDRVRGP